MEYQFSSGISRPKAGRLSLALSSVLHDPIDTRRGILKSRARKDLSQVPPSRQVASAKMPPNQNSWIAPESWTLDTKLTPLRFTGREAAPRSEASSFRAEEFMPRDPFETSTLDTHPYYRYSTSSHSRQSSEWASSSTTSPERISMALHYSDMSETYRKQEKAPKLKRIYKRASQSTKALARMLSISKRNSKRSSLIPPVPPFSSSSLTDHLPSDSSYNLSPPSSNFFDSSTRRRNGSTPDVKQTLSVDVRSRLKRSLSVSSPLGIPSPPLLSRFNHQQPQHKNIRGRDIPFPLTPSVVSLPLPSRQTRKNSEESPTITSTDTLRKPQFATNNQGRYPMPHIVPSLRASLRARVTPPPEGPLPAAPASTLAQAPVPMSRTMQRNKSRSMREFEPLRYNEGSTVEAPQRYQQQDEQHGQRRARLFVDESRINDMTSSFLAIPPPSRTATASGGKSSPPRSIPASRSRIVDEPVQSGLEIIFPLPSSSPTSVTAAFLDWDASKFKETGGEEARRGERKQPRASAARDVNSTPFVRSPGQTQKAEVAAHSPLPPSVVGGLSERRNAQSTRDLSRRTPRVGPAVPSPLSIRTQNNNTSSNSEDNGYHSIPRSPSLPSLRPGFSDQVPRSESNTNSYHEGPETRPGILRGITHVRSPSLPIFPSTNNVQRLPPSVIERLRSRTRSSSRSEDGRRHVAESRPPSLVKSSPDVKPYASSDSLPNVLSTSSRSSPQPQDFRAPPSHAVSRLLRTRTRQLRASELEAAKFKSPSLPDLHSAYPQNQGRGSLGSQSQSRLARSPPPPVPQIRTPPVHVLPRQGTATARPDPPPIVTASRFLRPRPNLRTKENSYPPMSNNSLANFQARSNKELAEEGGWDFMDTPPRPARSSVMIPTTPVTLVDGHSQAFRQRRQQDQQVQSQPFVPTPDVINASPVSGLEGEGEWMVGEAL